MSALAGFVAGVVLTAATFGILLVYFIVTRSKAAPRVPEPAPAEKAAPAGIVKDPVTPGADVADASWPREAVDKIRAALSKTDTVESCQWLNIVMMRFFLEIRASKFLRAKLCKRLTAKLQPKIAGSNYIKAVTISDLSFGDTAPQILAARVVGGPPDRNLTVEVDLEVRFSGNILLVCDVELSMGAFIPLAATLSELNGQLRVRVPRPEDFLHFNVSFVPEPQFKLEVSSRFVYDKYEYLPFRDSINGFLSKKLSQLFREMWVLPARRFFDLPLINLPGQHPNCRCNLSNPIAPTKVEAPAQAGQLYALGTKLNDENEEAVLLAGDAVLTAVRQLANETELGAKWIPVKERNGLTIHQRQALKAGDPTIFRSSLTVKCRPALAFSILSNPNHRKHVDEDVADSVSIRSYSTVAPDLEGRALASLPLPSAAMPAIPSPALASPSPPTASSSAGTPFPEAPRPTNLRNSVGSSSVTPLTIPTELQPVMGPSTPSGGGGGVRELSVHIRQYAFTAGKEFVDVAVLDASSRPAKSKKNDEGTQVWVIGQRSIDIQTPVKPWDPQKSTRATLHLAGFQITSIEGQPNSCIVTVITQVDTNGKLARLQTNMKKVETLRNLLENIGITPLKKMRISAESEDVHTDEEDEVESALGVMLLVPGEAKAAYDLLASPDVLNAPRPRVSSDTYHDIANQTVALLGAAEVYFTAKLNVNFVELPRAKTMFLKYPLAVSCVDVPAPPEFIYRALFGPTMRYTANPSLQACDTLTVYDKHTAVRHFVFEASRWASLPPRDAVLLEVARQNGLSYVVAQTSVDDDAMSRTQGTLRMTIPIAGYVLRGAVNSSNEVQTTRLMHFIVLDAPGLVHSQVQRILLSYCGIMDQISFALVKAFQSPAPRSLLDVERMSGASDTHIVVRSGEYHMVRLPSDGNRRRFCQLQFRFMLIAAEVRFGILFVPDTVDISVVRHFLAATPNATPPAKVVQLLPMGVWAAQVNPVVGRLDIPWNARGTVVLLWDNTASRITAKRLRLNCSFAFGNQADDSSDAIDEKSDLLSLPLPQWEQVVSGEIVVGRKESARIPMVVLPEMAGKKHELAWEFVVSEDALNFSVVFQKGKLLGKGDAVAQGDELHASERVTARPGGVAGKMPFTPEAGTLMFVWDNESMFFSRRVTFNVRLVRV